MPTLIWKLRIATLWITCSIGITALFAVSVLESGMIADVQRGRVEGTDTGQVAVVGAIYILVPLAMAFLTFVLHDPANRWANGVVGAAFALSMAPDVVGHLGKLVGVVIVVVATTLAGLLVVWHAWRWPVSDEEVTSREHLAGSRS